MMNTMDGTRSRSRRAIALVAIGVTGAALAACTAPTDRVGAELPPQEVTLRMASVVDGTPAQIGAYIDAVAEI